MVNNFLKNRKTKINVIILFSFLLLLSFSLQSHAALIPDGPPGDCYCDVAGDCNSGYTKTSRSCNDLTGYPGTYCAKDSATTCDETDGGIEACVYGICTLTDACDQVVSIEYDSCLDSTTLRERYCFSNTQISSNTMFTLDYECIGGN